MLNLKSKKENLGYCKEIVENLLGKILPENNELNSSHNVSNTPKNWSFRKYLFLINLLKRLYNFKKACYILMAIFTNFIMTIKHRLTKTSKEHMKRPPSITALCWFQILTTLLGLFAFFGYFLSPNLEHQIKQALIDSPFPASLNLILFFISAYFCTYAAVLMFKGHPLGRKISVILVILSFAFNLIERDYSLVRIMINLLILFILFRPSAQAYFAQYDKKASE
ncbi:hypothetical protein [Pasteurella sp. PK-2025]|uniref:hypothetical protein n=1 Tax=Pasteurella sp. PK-2025 TaxID=3413133 RepID=UPI003C70D30B